jgi:hypothetical protein
MASGFTREDKLRIQLTHIAAGKTNREEIGVERRLNERGSQPGLSKKSQTLPLMTQIILISTD